MIRTALSRSFAASAKRCASTISSAGQKTSSYLPYYLLGTGTVGAAGYLYLERQSKHSAKQEKGPLDPNNFIDFKLKKVEPYNHNTAKFIFELPNNEAASSPVASCLVVRASDPQALTDAKGNPIVRPYTPISAPDEKGVLTLLVKKYDNGNASKFIHGMKEGETLAIKGPIPKFPYQINEFDQVALIGGGSGITPLYQVLTHALSDKANKTKFKLLFSNVTSKDILLREELDALQKKYPENLDIVYLVDKPEGGWKGPTGFITSDTIKKHVAPPTLKDKVKIFVCGPPGQVSALAGKKAGMKQGELGGILKDLGYSEEQVFKF